MKYVFIAYIGFIVWLGPLRLIKLKQSNKRVNRGKLKYAERLNLRR